MNKLTATTECPCGNPAVKFRAGVPCCAICDGIEAGLERERDSRARRLFWENKYQLQREEELAA